MLRPQMNGEAVRLAVFYGAYFTISGFYTPYWPVVLEERGLAPGEIGLIFGLAMVIRPLIVPAYGYAADRYLGLKRMLIILTALTAISFLGFFGARNFAGLLAVTMVLMLFWPAILPMAEAMTLRAQMKGRLTYGPVRLWGSVTFVMMNLLGGYVLATGGTWAIHGAVLCAASLCFLAALWQKAPEPLEGEEAVRPTLKELVAALSKPVLLLGLISAALIDATHVLYYAYGTIHWTSQGLGGGVIGPLWATGVVAEVVLMALAGKWIAQRPGSLFILIGGLGAAARWALMALDPPLGTFFLIQSLHALSYGATLLGLMSLIARHAPARFAGSIQGFFNAVAAGLFSSSMMMGSGVLYGAFAGRAFLVMAAIAGIGLIGAAIAFRLERAGVASLGTPGVRAPLPISLEPARTAPEPKP